MSMYTRAEALRVRDTIFGGLEIIAGTSDPNTGAFTVVIVGGGATGVEMAGQLAELKTETIPSTYPELNPARVHVVLVEMTGHLLAPFDDSLRKYALRELIKRGVDVRLNTAISEVHADRVDFKDGSSMPVDLVIWAAGVAGSPDAPDLGAADRPRRADRGQRGHPGGRLREHLRHRRLAASSSTTRCRSWPSRRSRWASTPAGRSPGSIAAWTPRRSPTTTRAPWPRSAAAMRCCRCRSGSSCAAWLAWLGWIALHIVFLLGGRNRVQTLINLGSRYAGPRRSNAIVGDVMEPPRIRMAREVGSKRQRSMTQA